MALHRALFGFGVGERLPRLCAALRSSLEFALQPLGLALELGQRGQLTAPLVGGASEVEGALESRFETLARGLVCARELALRALRELAAARPVSLAASTRRFGRGKLPAALLGRSAAQRRER